MSLSSRSQTVIVMGEGDVLIGHAAHGNGSGSLCFLAAGETKELGTPAPEFDGQFGLGDVDVSISFIKLASVDSMIGRLHELRAQMVERGAK